MIRGRPCAAPTAIPPPRTRAARDRRRVARPGDARAGDRAARRAWRGRHRRRGRQLPRHPHEPGPAAAGGAAVAAARRRAARDPRGGRRAAARRDDDAPRGRARRGGAPRLAGPRARLRARRQPPGAQPGDGRRRARRRRLRLRPARDPGRARRARGAALAARRARGPDRRAHRGLLRDLHRRGRAARRGPRAGGARTGGLPQVPLSLGRGPPVRRGRRGAQRRHAARRRRRVRRDAAASRGRVRARRRRRDRRGARARDRRAVRRAPAADRRRARERRVPPARRRRRGPPRGRGGGRAVSAIGVDPRVTGARRYAVDLERPDMLHAAFVRSPHPHARVHSVDVSALPEDCVALVPDDVEDLHRYGCQVRDEHVLARVARHAGDVVAAIAAPTREAARAATALVDVQYEELPALFDPLDAVAPGAPLLHPEGARSAQETVSIGVRPLAGTNVCHRFRLVHGDVAEGFAEADVVVQQAFRTPSAAHVPMEPHAAVAEGDDGGRLTVWTGTQTPFNLRTDLAVAFGVEEERVRIVGAPMGGSFGAKTFVRHEAPLAALARKAGRPVKVVLDRAEEFVTLNRHPSVIRVRLGAKRDGTLVAKELDCWVDTGAYADCGPGVATKLGYAGVGPYRIPHVRVDSLAIYTNLPPNGAFRGYGSMQSIWASERTMDVLAGELEMSPLELRRMNLLRDGDVFATGEVMHDVQFERCLQAAADAVGYEDDPAGKGLCVLLKGMQTPSRAAISVERTPVGYVVRSASTEMGQGVRRSIQLMAASLLECEPGQVVIPDPDTATTPFDTRTTSSRSTHMMGRALEVAVADLRTNGGDRGEGEVRDEGGLDPDTGQGVASTHWHQGAAAAHVTVDEETGRVTVEQLHGVAYAGRVVDREGAELQNEGSLTMGLGTALFEAVDFDAGQVANANLSDYNVPGVGDLPKRFTHELIEREGAEAHGLGETVLPPVPAAIGNALYSLGIEVHELPMSPERVLRAIDAREASP